MGVVPPSDPLLWNGMDGLFAGGRPERISDHLEGRGYTTVRVAYPRLPPWPINGVRPDWSQDDAVQMLPVF